MQRCGDSTGSERLSNTRFGPQTSGAGGVELWVRERLTSQEGSFSASAADQ